MSENHYCYNCRFYKPYYTKGNTQFNRLDYGLCGRKKEGVEKHCNCEFFSYKYVMRVDRKQAALAAITEHVNVLSDLKQIIEEDDEERLEELFSDIKHINERRKKRRISE